MQPSPETATLLTEIINSVYDDGVENILEHQVEDNGDQLVLALDGIKQLAVKILAEPDSDGNQIYIRLMNPDEVDPTGASDPAQQVAQAEAAVQFAEMQEADTINRFVERLRKQAQPELEKMLSQVREALDGSTDLVQFRERLDTLYPELDGETLTRTMAEAMFASKLAGIFEAEEGA